MTPPINGVIAALNACTENIRLIADPAMLRGTRSIIQPWMTGRMANMLNPRSEMPMT